MEKKNNPNSSLFSYMPRNTDGVKDGIEDNTEIP